MSGTPTANRRLAKNSLVLYLRMIITLIIQLYTSRLVLQALGVEDFGIYNVVGGVIAMLNFVNMSLSNANSRFIAVEIGYGVNNKVKEIFSYIMTIHWIFAIVIIIIAETVGLWFVKTQLVIPADRMNAALWVYQSCVFSSIITITSAPYNGLIIAHEKMSAFALISIIDSFTKLGIAIAVFYSNHDRLILYAILHVCAQFIIRAIYTVYCVMNFPESRYKLMWNKKQSANILGFAGWTLTGNIAVMGYTQGLNILLNLFFGAAINAARGISVQVQNAVKMLTNGFQTAVNPQIFKSYAQNDIDRLKSLLFMSSRFSFYLMLLISIPLCFHTQYILQIWLGVVPEYTSSFVRVMLIAGLISTLQNPTMTVLHATGNLKKVQIIESSILLFVVPIDYLCLKFLHISPVMVFIVYLIIEIIAQFVRVFLIYPMINLKRKEFYSKILLPISIVSLFATSLCWIINCFIIVSNIWILIGLFFIYIITIGTIIFLLGLSNNEKEFIVNLLKHKLLKH